MITSITFLLSLIGIIFLFANKSRELKKGQPFLRLSYGSDHELKQVLSKTKESVRNFPKKAGHVTAYYAVKHGLSVFEKTKKIVYPKISHIVDAVKGRDIPKNRGSVSLFLKHIEEHKRKQRA